MERDSTWCVIRTDDNGNRSVVAKGLSFEEAVRLENLMASRGHKQLYEIDFEEHGHDDTTSAR